MSSLDPLLERNRGFAATGAHAGLAIMPRQQVFLVTCLDSRADPAQPRPARQPSAGEGLRAEL